MIGAHELYFIVLTLPIVAQTEGGGGANATNSSTTPPNGGSVWELLFQSPLGFMILSLAMLYLMVILPQQRSAKAQQRQLAEMLKNLKKNDRVITSSGIHGVVLQASADAPTVTIRIDDATNAKMTVNREVIVSVTKDETKGNS